MDRRAVPVDSIGTAREFVGSCSGEERVVELFVHGAQSPQRCLSAQAVGIGGQPH